MLKSILCSATTEFSEWLRCMSHMLFEFGLNGSASLSDIYFTAFTGDTLYTRDFHAQFVLGRSKHVYILFWLGGCGRS